MLAAAVASRSALEALLAAAVEAADFKLLV